MRPRNLAHGGGELLASAGRPASTLTQKETPARVAVHLGRTRCNGSTQRRKDARAQRVGEEITSGNSRPDLRQIRSRRLSETASVAGLR